MEARSPLKGRPLRVPGESIDRQISNYIDDQALLWMLLPVVTWALAVVEWIAVLRDLPRIPWTYTILAVSSTIVAVAMVLRARWKVRALRLGRDGERVVGQFLDGLRVNGARIFHDVPAQGFNLDHVVISDRGVYVIETKTYSKPHADAKVTFADGKLLVAGRALNRDPIKQVRGEIDWLRRMLEESTSKRFAVRGVVVFPGWWVDPAPESIKAQAWVLEPKALPGWIEKEPVSIAPTDVSLAAFHLSRYVRTAEVK
jgi:hypothetical protein